MEFPLITIVLPIYNVADYLEECLKSIMIQTYKNIEIILVDDGSTDRCPAICDEYKNQDSRITVIHKKNGGLSDARNVGIDNSNGEYLALVDSDDKVMPQFIERLYFACISSNSKLSVCSFTKFDDVSDVKRYMEEKNVEVMEGSELIKRIYQGNGESISFTAWNKLYHRTVFDEIRYPKGRIYEDAFVTYRLFLKAEKIAVIDEPLYLYRVRSGSIMTNKLSLKKLKDGVDADASVVKYFFDTNNKDLMSYAGVFFCRNMFIAYYKEVKKMDPKSKKDAQKYIIKEYRNTWLFCKNMRVSIIKKMFFNLFYLICQFKTILDRLMPENQRNV